MDELNKIQIEAADEILKDCASGIIVSPQRLLGKSNDQNWGWEIRDITDAAYFLEENGFINYVTNKGYHEYVITETGLKFYQKGKKIDDFLNEAIEKQAAKLKEEEQSRYYKNLQIRELEEKLKVMNVEQRDFWNAQKQKNLQTTLLGIISAIFSLIALLKAWDLL